MEKNSSRTFINIIGIPSLLTIIIVGDSYLQLPIFSLFIGIVLFLGIRELPALIKGLDSKNYFFLLFLFITIMQIDRHPAISWDIPIYYLVLCITIAGFFIEIFNKGNSSFENLGSLLFVYIWLGVMLGSLASLRNIPSVGFSITLALFLSVWICDTAAFGFGMKWGKRKILPYVSHNKTWVGSIAGLFSSIVFMLSIYQCNYFTPQISVLDAIAFGFIAGIFGQLGDFSESMIKREANIKRDY